MDVYLASPNTQQQAEHCGGMNVLLSFAIFGKWMWQYQPSFEKVLIDSGAFSEMNSGVKIDIQAYKDWSELWLDRASGIAGLDNIEGDWKQSLKNYEAIPWSFPTWHDTDPPELLDDLIAMAKERKTWVGIGLLPPRHGKEKIVKWALDRIPESIHVHGWALRAYTRLQRLDSVDSTNWWRDAMALRKAVPWLHYGECLGLIVKRYQRENRVIYTEVSLQENLF